VAVASAVPQAPSDDRRWRIVETRMRRLGQRPDALIEVLHAAQGTLLHHYRVDRDGIVQWANLVIATGHNNLAMNRSVAQVARH
jgi:NAD-reducing hydrogenase large subunit